MIDTSRSSNYREGYCGLTPLLITPFPIAIGTAFLCVFLLGLTH